VEICEIEIGIKKLIQIFEMMKELDLCSSNDDQVWKEECRDIKNKSAKQQTRKREELQIQDYRSFLDLVQDKYGHDLSVGPELRAVVTPAGECFFGFMQLLKYTEWVSTHNASFVLAPVFWRASEEIEFYKAFEPPDLRRIRSSFVVLRFSSRENKKPIEFQMLLPIPMCQKVNLRKVRRAYSSDRSFDDESRTGKVLSCFLSGCNSSVFQTDQDIEEAEDRECEIVMDKLKHNLCMSRDYFDDEDQARWNLFRSNFREIGVERSLFYFDRYFAIKTQKQQQQQLQDGDNNESAATIKRNLPQVSPRRFSFFEDFFDHYANEEEFLAFREELMVREMERKMRE
jgi:hypothetical protein